MAGLLPFADEVARQTDAVIELGKTIIHLRRRHLASGEEVEFVAEIYERAPLLGPHAGLPFLHGLYDLCRSGRIELLQRIRIRAVFRDAYGHYGDGEHMRPPGNELTQRALKLRAVIQTGTQYDLGMILDTSLLQMIELLADTRSTGTAQHGRPQFRIHALYRYVERRQVQPADAVEITGPHIRQRDEIAIEERETIVIILYGQACAHARSHHVHEAEIAVIRAAADAIEYRRSEFATELLIDVFLERYDFTLSIGMLDQQIYLLIGQREAQIDDITQRLFVYGNNLVAADESQLRSQALLRDPCYYTWIFFAHIQNLINIKSDLSKTKE